VALREFGRIERTLFTLDWLLDKNLRQRVTVTAGLNKGELKNTLAKAVCFNRLGELRDRSFEAQHHRASGLNLVVATIILWNTVYLELAIGALRQQGRQIDDGLLNHVAPVHWNHINLTGDYYWRQNKRVEKGGLRQRYHEGQEDQLGALGLVVNIIVLWNTLYINAALQQLEQEGFEIQSEDIARLSPLVFEHINVLGRYSFSLPDAVSRGELRPLRNAFDALEEIT
jgi:TnpA family transposase